MAIKRKAVVASADSLFKGSKAASHKDAEMDVEPEGEDVNEPVEEAEESEPTLSPEEMLKQSEQELSVARKKELKSLSAEAINKLLLDSGLEKSNKTENIEKILKAEAKGRKVKRDHEAKLRAVVCTKKEEFEALSVSDLANQCIAIGLKGKLSKQARVEGLVKQWLEDDGINKALAQEAHNQRKEELVAMDSAGLVNLCKKMSIEAFVTEVMIERVLKREAESGRFSRPVFEEEAKSTAAAPESKARDVVEALLAGEAARKKELQQKQQDDKEMADKLKELSAKSKEDLDKMIKKKGLEATGTKNVLVAALYAEFEAERKVLARKAELQAMGKDALKELCTRKRLATSPKVEGMITTLLDHETQCRQKIKAYQSAYETVVEEVIATKKEELNKKSAAELKDMLTAKGLKPGQGKEERVEKLLEDVRNQSGEIEKTLVSRARESRRTELLGMDKKPLRMLCEELGADPFVREVAVERILDAEAEAPAELKEPAAKRAKK